jgi:hypothetical protein
MFKVAQTVWERLVRHLNLHQRKKCPKYGPLRYFVKIPQAFRNPLTEVLVAFGNFFVIALAAFNKISRDYEALS